MNKIIMVAAVCGMALSFTACSDDSSSSASSKACVYKVDGKIASCTSDADGIETWCKGSESTTAELVDACPAGYKLECPTGDKMFGTQYYYDEYMTSCGTF